MTDPQPELLLLDDSPPPANETILVEWEHGPVTRYVLPSAKAYLFARAFSDVAGVVSVRRIQPKE